MTHTALQTWAEGAQGYPKQGPLGGTQTLLSTKVSPSIPHRMSRLGVIEPRTLRPGLTGILLLGVWS